ncbi:MAG: T9SS type A sorting domain-containing protein [bacterium]
MKHIFLIILAGLCHIPALWAQTEILIPTVDKPVYFDVSPPLRDMYRIAPGPVDRSWKDGVVPNRFNQEEPGTEAGILNAPDAALQDYFGSLLTDTTISNFDGLAASGSVPPDTYGEAGLTYYYQVVNTSYAIFNKTGEIIFGPYPSHSIWMGMPNNDNSGDAVVLYDETADRWLFTQFSLPNYPSGPFFQMIAVSQTNDPTGSWYRWQYEFPLMPDYPKFGVWTDGYYMSSNNFGSSGFANNGAYGFDRSAMLAGATDPILISFTLNAGGGGFNTIYPADCDGPLPSFGTPNYFGFIKRSSPQYFGIYEFHADFVNPYNSTFSNLLSLNVTPFTSQLDGIPQPGTNVKLETISDRLMYRLQFRKFNGYDVLVANHTVNAGGGIAGVRWYEFRKTTGAWSVYQQGTYAPADNNSRWMGSIAIDTAGSIALGYSISSSALYPSIRYTGRLKTDPLNQLSIAEKTIITGGGSQTGMWSGRSRWGDYSGMSVDPANPTTFWYTTEYYPTTSSSNWRTRIGSFTFANVFSTFASATPAKFCLGLDTVQLNVLAYGGTNTYTYSWSSIPAGFTSNLQNPQVISTDTTQYIVSTTSGTLIRSDTVLVKVVYPPEANAGEDTTICAWAGSIDLHGIAAHYRNFVWGSFGDGTFSNMYELQTTYYPGNEDRTNGGVDLVLVAFANTPCQGKIMDTLHLGIDPCTGIEETVPSLSVRVIPNPACEKVTLTIQSPSQTACSLTITGMDGRVFYAARIPLEKGRTETVIDLSGYSKGVYLVQVKTESEVISRQLVVQ